MSNRAPTDQEIAQMWDEECKARREEIARRNRLIDAMRQAGFAKPKQEAAHG